MEVGVDGEKAFVTKEKLHIFVSYTECGLVDKHSTFNSYIEGIDIFSLYYHHICVSIYS